MNGLAESVIYGAKVKHHYSSECMDNKLWLVGQKQGEDTNVFDNDG